MPPHMHTLPDAHGVPVAQKFITHAILYLQDSPAGIFLCWVIGRSSTKSSLGIGSQQTKHDQQNTGTEAFEHVCHDVQKFDQAAPCNSTYKIHLANRQCEQGAQSWPLPKRVLVAGIICLYTFIVYAASAIYIVGLKGTMVEFKISEQQSLLGLSLYVLAYGLGPMIWAPLSEEAYIGRSMIYALTFVVFVCLSVLSATVTSWESFLAVRFFQAFFGSPCLAIGGASMHDLLPNSSVPYSLVFWIAAAYCGPALGPLIASYLVPKKGWRWGMWEIAFLAVPTLVLMLTLPETHRSTLIARKARPDMARPETEDPRTASSIARGIIESLGGTFVRPLQIASLDPAVAVANFYIAFMDDTSQTPQSIPAWFFYFTMRLETPCIFAATYMLAVKYLNANNRKRGYKPWVFTDNVCWKTFVMLHNTGLATFSLATFIGVYNAILSSASSQYDSPGLAGIAKSLCRLHGQPLDDFERNAFGRLSTDDVAFWAWIFYLSKFYEVLDTLVILAKGKKSSSLQTYHHAGVIVCLWSGIRYMSPPMWIGLLLNSFIHTLMYTYFALTSVHVNIPSYLKRTLTTMQIAQFYMGAILTSLYLFARYDISVIDMLEMPSLDVAQINNTFIRRAPVYNLRFELSSVLTKGGSFFGSSSASNQVGGTISDSSQSSNYDILHSVHGPRVRCIGTPGEAVYILAGLTYLIPLIALFSRFFYKAYLKTTVPPSRATKTTTIVDIG
ncbi:hypothetical protein MBLNU13_g02557t1 [Cladosporium sp. NU13]